MGEYCYIKFFSSRHMGVEKTALEITCPDGTATRETRIRAKRTREEEPVLPSVPQNSVALGKLIPSEKSVSSKAMGRSREHTPTKRIPKRGFPEEIRESLLAW